MAIFLGLKVQNGNREIIFPLHVKVKEPPVAIKKEPAIYLSSFKRNRTMTNWGCSKIGVVFFNSYRSSCRVFIRIFLKCAAELCEISVIFYDFLK